MTDQPTKAEPRPEDVKAAKIVDLNKQIAALVKEREELKK